MNILLVIAGSISACKAPSIIGGLKKRDHHVCCAWTKNAERFMGIDAIRFLADETLEEDWGEANHLLSSEFDIFVVAPASTNIIAKFAGGIADDFATSSYMASPLAQKRIMFPSMNTKMWKHMATRRNLTILQKYDNWNIRIPEEGKLACGDVGIGKLPSTREICDDVELVASGGWMLGSNNHAWRAKVHGVEGV